MWCYDAPSCLLRKQQTPFLTSTTKLSHSMEMGGIFDNDPKRSPFGGANRVYLAYCSSDAWAGDAGPESNSFGFQFRGQRIIAATLRTLMLQHGLGAPGSNSRLLFSGCSAGSRGAMFNLDFIAPIVGPDVAVSGMFDSPLWARLSPLLLPFLCRSCADFAPHLGVSLPRPQIDIQPDEPQIVPLENETQAIYTLINATARLDAACAETYPGPEGWKCLYGQYRMPFIRTRYLLSASQFDRYQLPYNEGQSPPYGGAKLTYADDFQAIVSSIVHSLPNSEQPGSAVFSSACFKHCTSDSGSFWGVRIRGQSLKDVLAAWWGAPPGGAGLQVIESCTGFGCGECHHHAPPSPPPAAPGRGGSGSGSSGSSVAVAAGGHGGGVSARAAARLHKRRSGGSAGAGGGGAHVLLLAVGGAGVALCACGCLARACFREEAIEAERLRSVEMARPLAGRAPPPPRPPVRGLR